MFPIKVKSISDSCSFISAGDVSDFPKYSSPEVKLAESITGVVLFNFFVVFMIVSNCFK